MKSQQILPIVKEWQERPLEEVYAVVFMDAIHYHVRSEGRIVKRAVYIALSFSPTYIPRTSFFPLMSIPRAM